MMTRRILRTVLATGLTLLSAAGGAEEGTIEAFSQWEARGQVFPTGLEEATFVGVLSGVIYVKDDGDELTTATLDAGVIQCPGTLVINTSDGSQHGNGKCVVLTPDGERVFGAFTCRGTHLEGCQGDFTLTGATGTLQGLSGSGPLQLKSAFTEYLRATPGSIVQQTAVGLAVWPKLTYQLP
jgi:hypothetical protein